MPFAAALSTLAQTDAAIDEVCREVAAALEQAPDLGVLFFSAHHLPQAELLARTVNERLRPRSLLGCVGEAVIGNDQEVEGRPALSLWAGKWRRSLRITPFHLTLERTPDGPSLLGHPDELLEADPARSAILLLGDPYSFPPDLFLQQINDGSPGMPVLGGMASGIAGADEARLLLGHEVHSLGAVGVLLQGDLGLRSIVSQGCRPIGRHFVVTRAEENLILELGGRTPLEQLREMWETLSSQEQKLFQQGLHIGRVINEYQDLFQRGDFLVRNVIGLQRENGALAITDQARVGQTVQFHVRDADTADEDLHALLQLDLNAHDRPPGAALVFSCNGRGSRLFTTPSHDARVIQEEAGPIPLAGFFAMGELGPVGKKNFIHGFTASIAFFEE